MYQCWFREITKKRLEKRRERGNRMNELLILKREGLFDTVAKKMKWLDGYKIMWFTGKW